MSKGNGKRSTGGLILDVILTFCTGGGVLLPMNFQGVAMMCRRLKLLLERVRMQTE